MLNIRKVLFPTDFSTAAQAALPTAVRLAELHGAELHLLHYGAIPIAPRSGAFADALVDFDAVTGTGTAFLYAPGSDRELVTAARRAIRTFQHRDSLERLRDRGMRTDLSWRTAATRYAELYREALRMRHRPAA